jgi:hypothetical protein
MDSAPVGGRPRGFFLVTDIESGMNFRVGDSVSHAVGRFIESSAFVPSRTEPGAVELETPNRE